MTNCSLTEAQYNKTKSYIKEARGDYKCFLIPVTAKLPNSNKAPYVIKDAFGNEYHCISYLDYKYAESGTEMIGVVLENGKRFAMQQYDAANPYARDHALHCEY